MPSHLAVVPDDMPSLTELTAITLDAVVAEYDKYVVFPNDECRDAVALWILHTYVFDQFQSTPRLSVRSTEPGSGKSRVLEIASELCPDVLMAVYLTPGVMWRKIEHGKPTIMLDECDTIFGKNGSSTSHQELRALINAGHRRGNTIPRCVGSTDVKEFRVYAPVAMAGIGRLPETIWTRAVEIVMRKRREGDPTVKPFDEFAQEDLADCRKTVERWAMRAVRVVAASIPDMPVADRKADVWRALLSIAQMAGEDWKERARKACIRLTTEADEKPMTIGARLLTDIRTAFGDERVLTISQLTDALAELEDAPWSDGFTSGQMSRLLGEYDIRSKTTRLPGNSKPQKAYHRSDFERAWERYCKPVAPKPEDDEEE